MRVHNRTYRSIWPSEDGRSVHIIDQTQLPYDFVTRELRSSNDIADAIATMKVRGAPLIGVAAAYGFALAMRESSDDSALARAYEKLLATRPTAVNLRWALNRMWNALLTTPGTDRRNKAWSIAGEIAAEDVEINREIGRHGAELLRRLHAALGRPVNILTHCNTGWLATVDYGTALSAVYQAFDARIPVHVYVSETRPRNQGILTWWELEAHGVPQTFIADNAAGHLLRTRRVDIVIVGADRVTRGGDVCNKVGTYLKALAARDNDVPFYAAVPSPTIDWSIERGDDVAIEERAGSEVRTVVGRDSAGKRATVSLVGNETQVANPAFDVTPARLVTGIITERGVAVPAEIERLNAANAARLAGLEPRS